MAILKIVTEIITSHSCRWDILSRGCTWDCTWDCYVGGSASETLRYSVSFEVRFATIASDKADHPIREMGFNKDLL